MGAFGDAGELEDALFPAAEGDLPVVQDAERGVPNPGHQSGAGAGAGAGADRHPARVKGDDHLVQAAPAGHLRKQLAGIELELAGLIAAERVAGPLLVGPGAGPNGFHVADGLVFQSVPGSVRGSPNRGITLAPKPVTAVMRSSAIVTTSSP
jgi:hypothetical protein